MFWRCGWAGETEEAKLSLFSLLQRGSAEGGISAVRQQTYGYICLLMITVFTLFFGR